MTIQNLTKLIILGILNDYDKSLHGYEIKKIINKWKIQEISDFSYGSIYYNLEQLKKNGFVLSETKRDTKRPERRIYTISENGKNKFLQILRENYNTYEKIRYPFDIGVLFMPALSKEEIIEAIDKRIKLVDKNEKSFDKLISFLKNKIPFFSLYIILHHLFHHRAEKEWLKALKKEVESRNTIGHDFTKNFNARSN